MSNLKLILAALLWFNDLDKWTKIIYYYNGRRYELGLLSICDGFPNYEPLDVETLKIILEDAAEWRYVNWYYSVQAGLPKDWIIATLRTFPRELPLILPVKTDKNIGFKEDGCFARMCLKVASQWVPISNE
ncbi:MAG: hypothetical protein Q4Q53_07010 [Methanocorpusculum sp.]|nr:hypothetical protein [Methanocorpusculum sp.]